MNITELRRVDSYKEISFKGERFKILSPSVLQHDLVSVELTEKGVALYCAAGHVPLQFEPLSLSGISVKRPGLHTGPGHTCRTKSNCEHLDNCCAGISAPVRRLPN